MSLDNGIPSWFFAAFLTTVPGLLQHSIKALVFAQTTEGENIQDLNCTVGRQCTMGLHLCTYLII